MARSHPPRPGPVYLPPRPNSPADRFPALCLGSSGGHQDHRVPRAPLPGMGVTHRQGDLTSHLRGRYPSVVAPTGSCARPSSSPRLGGPSVGESVQVVASPLLDHGPSRHCLCHLCGGAWTHTPPCSSGAQAHFFPNDSGLTSRETRSAHGKTPARRFRQGAYFRGCSHSLIFRLPHLLGLQVAPTAVRRLGGQAVYTTHRPRGSPPRDVVSLHV